jgi:hypothetical protein
MHVNTFFHYCNVYHISRTVGISTIFSLFMLYSYIIILSAKTQTDCGCRLRVIRNIQETMTIKRMNKTQFMDRCDIMAELLSVIHSFYIRTKLLNSSFSLNFNSYTYACIFLLLIVSCSFRIFTLTTRYTFLLPEIYPILYEYNRIHVCCSYNFSSIFS